MRFIFPSRWSRFLKIFLFFIILAAATLLLVEFTLRAAGATVLLIQRIQNKVVQTQRTDLKIMCIGESTTYLGGIDSYPSQLGRILNKRYPRKHIAVINQGVPGIGTGFIMDNLPRWIESSRPDVIVAMMGINDSLAPAILQKNHFFKFIQQSRIYKLYRWLSVALRVREIEHLTGIAKDHDLSTPPLGYGMEALHKFRQYPKGFMVASAAVSYMKKGNYFKAQHIFEVLLSLKYPLEI